MGQRAGDPDGLLLWRNDGSPLEHAAQTFDVGERPVREVAERAFANFAALAIALAEQDGGG